MLAAPVKTTSDPSTWALPPLASTLAASLGALTSAPAPRTSISPAKVVRPCAVDKVTLPPSRPDALSCAPASTASARSATMLMVPPAPVMALGIGVMVAGATTGTALALTTAPLSRLTFPLSDRTSMLPPRVPSATVWLPCPSVASPLAASTMRPPCPSAVCARMSPECFKVPANTPTAPPLNLPSTCAWFAGACSSNFMSFKLRLPISTFSPAANTTLPPALLITPSRPTVTLGAMM